MTVSQADFDALKAQVTKLVDFMGDMDISHADDVAGHYHNGAENPNGDLKFVQNAHQLREDVNQKNEQIGRLWTEVAALKTQIAALPAPSSSAPVSATVNMPGLGNGVHFKSGTFEAVIFISDYDHAMRILTNHKDNDAGGFTHAIPTMAQQRIDIEQFGLGYMFYPPLKNPDGSPFAKNALDSQGGKSLIIRGGEDSGHRSPYVQIYAGHPGQGLRIGVSPTTPNVMASPTIQIEPDGTKSKG